jgi:eukaryotic-like serine/threonine-protein kinase
MAAHAYTPRWYHGQEGNAKKGDKGKRGAGVSDFVVEARADTLGLLGQVVANHHLLRVLGDGGMGCVYEGEHEILKERRAIKVCKVMASRAVKERAVNEARMMAKLHHPGICLLHDVQWGPPDGTSPVMVMELLQGHTFFDEIAREPVGWRRVVEVACDVLEALEYAHQEGIIHRDIKPENVFVATIAGKQVTKVMDFGIAKLAGVSATKTGMQMGTPH